MDEVYRGYFSRRVAAETPFETRTAQVFPTVTAAIAAASTRLPRSQYLRDDAVYFLRMNAEEMVLGPLLSAGQYLTGAIISEVQADMATLVEAAGELTDGNEVTAHSVIDAISGNWSRLSSMLPGFWG
jgi:hypothetical protein